MDLIMIATPTVFLPGTLCDETLWTHQAPLFTQKQIISLRTQSTVAEMIKSVAQASFDSFNLIGFSMGGYIAQEFALAFPERVKDLVVIGASSMGYPEEEKAIVRSSIGMIRKGSFTGISDRRLKDYLDESTYTNVELRQFIQKMGGDDAKDVYLRQLEATLDRRVLLADMAQLQVPTLFVAGENDKIVSLESIKASRLNAKADLAIVPHAGHFVPLEQPDDVCDILIKRFAKES